MPCSLLKNYRLSHKIRLNSLVLSHCSTTSIMLQNTYVVDWHCLVINCNKQSYITPLNTHSDIITYLLTPWCRVLEQLNGLQLVKKFPAFHGTRRFLTALTSVRYLSLPWTSPIQSIYPHSTSWRSILILSTHLRLGLPNGSFLPVSPARPYTPPSPHPYAPHAQPISFFTIALFTVSN